MKIECSRALCAERTDRQTDRQTEWHLELLSEPKMFFNFMFLQSNKSIYAANRETEMSRRFNQIGHQIIFCGLMMMTFLQLIIFKSLFNILEIYCLRAFFYLNNFRWIFVDISSKHLWKYIWHLYYRGVTWCIRHFHLNKDWYKNKYIPYSMDPGVFSLIVIILLIIYYLGTSIYLRQKLR